MANPIIYLAFTDGKRPARSAGADMGESGETEPTGGPAANRLDILDELIPEFQGIKGIFDTVPAVEVNPRLYDVTIKNMMADVHRLKDRIVVFHYGGHATDDTLVLEGDGDRSSVSSPETIEDDGGAVHAGGLAAVLGRLPHLRLVVLNGCGTVTLKNALLEAGVPAVIATSGDINDVSAREFSVEFYEHLTERRKGKLGRFRGRLPLDDAFFESTKKRKGQGFDIRTEVQTRGVGRPAGAPTPTPTSATMDHWGLYYEDKQVRSWRLLLPRNWRLRGRAKDWSLPMRAPFHALWGLMAALAALAMLRPPVMPDTSNWAYLVPAVLLLPIGALPVLTSDAYLRLYNGAAAFVFGLGLLGVFLYHGTTVVRVIQHPADIQMLEESPAAFDATVRIGNQPKVGFRLFGGYDTLEGGTGEGSGTQYLRRGTIFLRPRVLASWENVAPITVDTVREAAARQRNPAQFTELLGSPDENDRRPVQYEAQMVRILPIPGGRFRLNENVELELDLVRGSDTVSRRCTIDAPSAQVGWLPQVSVANCFLWEPPGV